MAGQSIVDLVDHLRGMESNFTSILFETALKMASIADISVFLLVETAEGRKFGGKRHLCDSYVGAGLRSLSNDDAECSLNLASKPLQERRIDGRSASPQQKEPEQQQQRQQQQQQHQRQQQQQQHKKYIRKPTAATFKVNTFSNQMLNNNLSLELSYVNSPSTDVNSLQPPHINQNAFPGISTVNSVASNASFLPDTSQLASTPSMPPPPPPPPLLHHASISAPPAVAVGSSNKRKQSRPKSIFAQHSVSPDMDENDGGGAPPPSKVPRTDQGLGVVARQNGLDDADVIEIKEEPPVISTPPLENGVFAIPNGRSNPLFEDFRDDMGDGFEAARTNDVSAALIGRNPMCSDLDGMALELFGGNQSVVVWNVRNYLATNMKATAMLTMEPMIDTHVDPSGRELKKHSAFMKMLSSILYDASKEAAMACPVKCKSDPSSKNFFSVVFEDLFAFFPNLNDLHVRGFRCPEGTRSYSVKTFCRNIMQRSFGFFLDKMR